MRLAALLALTLAACADGPAEAPLPASASFTVALDSLLRDDPARAVRIAIGVPQVQRKAGTPRAPALQAANAVLRDTVRALADDLRPEAPPRGADPTAVTARGGPTQMWLSDAVFSTLVEVSVSVSGAPAAVVFLPLTLDLTTGAAVAPADLFAPGTPWADTLAAHVGREVGRRAGQAPIAAVDLDAVRAGRVALTLGPDAVTVHLAPNQLAPGADAVHVGVPVSVLAAIARPGGVLARLGLPAGLQGEAPSPDRALGTD